MSVGRIIGGGIVAGLVINVIEIIMNLGVLAKPLGEIYATMGVLPPGGAVVGGFMVLGLVLGLLLAWTYAAIRPRLGAGPPTAFTAAMAVWIATAVVPTVGWLMMGLYPVSLSMWILGYTLVQLVVGALIAGAMYKEGPAPR